VLALVAPLVSALTLGTPSNVTSGGQITITWTAVPSDIEFTLELANLVFRDQIAIANNVDPSIGSLTVQCPATPTDTVTGYSINAVGVGNINQVFASSGQFDIGPPLTSSGAASTTASLTGSTTNSLASTAFSLPATSGTASGSISTPSSGAATTGTGSSSAPSTTPSSAAAASSRLALTKTGGYAVLLLSAVAGAVAIAL